MLRVDDPPDWLVRGRETKFPVGAVCVALVMGVGTVWAPVAVDVLLGGVGLMSMAVGGWLWSVRRQVDAMPLELSTDGVEGRFHGSRVAMVRGWLGAGRCVKVTHIHADIRTERGSGVQVEVPLPAGPRVGPWIVMVPVGQHKTGRLSLTVTVQAGSTVFETTRQYALEKLRSGRFASPVRGRPGEVTWNRGSWNEIEAPAQREDTA